LWASRLYLSLFTVILDVEVAIGRRGRGNYAERHAVDLHIAKASELEDQSGWVHGDDIGEEVEAGRIDDTVSN
jgi:hypothetical protein